MDNKGTITTSYAVEIPPTMNLPLEELISREREAYAAWNAADAAAKPLLDAWITTLRAVEKERLRQELLAELKATHHGERLPE
jgi:hypothetical protein